MASVYIPVQNSEEEVRVVLDQLPRDASDILDILKAEQAPLDLWLIIAVSYSTLYTHTCTELRHSNVFVFRIVSVLKFFNVHRVVMGLGP